MEVIGPNVIKSSSNLGRPGGYSLQNSHCSWCSSVCNLPGLQTELCCAWHLVYKSGDLIFSLFPDFCCFLTDNTQNIYRISPDGSLRVTFASGMEITLNTEPHILAGVVSPTLGKCNISLPGEHNSNLIEWRQRREQTKGNISTFERRLRVRLPLV